MHSPGYQFGVGPQESNFQLLACIYKKSDAEGSGSTERSAGDQSVASSRLAASGVTVVS